MPGLCWHAPAAAVSPVTDHILSLLDLQAALCPTLLPAHAANCGDCMCTCRRFEHDQYKAGFWRLLTDAGITLISDDEAGQLVGTSAQAAADFLAQHSAQRQVTNFACTSALQCSFRKPY